MNKRRFFNRTVHGGKVEIEGVIYQIPINTRQYADRIEGKRFSFGRYFTGDKCEDLIGLLECINDDSSPEVIDGKLLFMFLYSGRG